MRPLIMNQAWEVICQGGFRASLVYVLIASPSPAVRSAFMPILSRHPHHKILHVPIDLRPAYTLADVLPIELPGDEFPIPA